MRLCKDTFSILVGTIFENTKLPLKVWFGAIWLLTNHPKGIPSTTLAKDLGITQKSAWFVLHRLRHAAHTQSFNTPPMTGKVEIDETYVGRKAKIATGGVMARARPLTATRRLSAQWRAAAKLSIGVQI